MSASTRAGAPSKAARFLQQYGVVVALVMLVLVVSLLQPMFISFPNQMNILSQWAPVAVMGIGMTFVVITGGFDLSIAANYALCAVVAAALGQTQPPLVAFAVAVAVGAAVGYVNGLVVTLLRVNPFIATLGTSLIVSGATLGITGNKPFSVSFEPFTVLGRGELFGVPYSGIFAIALMTVAGLALAYTSWGHSIYAVGGNEEASRLAGIRTSGVVGSAYLLAGVSAGMAGILTASRLSSAQASLSGSLVFDVLTVVIVGGTALTGGRGAIWRTAVGVGLLATLQNGFNLLSVPAYFQDVIKGVIIVAAIATVDWSRLLSRVRAASTPPATTRDRTAAPPAPHDTEDSSVSSPEHRASTASVAP